MEKAKPDIECQISVLRKQSAAPHRYDAGAALERIEAERKHNPQSPGRDDPDDRSDRD